MNYYLTEDGCLMHYGIQGQKWGKRNGPPYPLGDSQMSKEEKKSHPLRRNIKQGKDKANTSPAEDSLKKIKDINEKALKIAKDKRESDIEEAKKNSDAKDLTTQELRDAVNRMDLEKRYNDLKYNDMTTEKDTVYKILDLSGDLLSIALSAASLAAIIYNMNK